MSASGDVTELLLAWNAGDRAALDNLIPIVYDELRRLASRQMRFESPEHTLQPTGLVNEAYLRLIDLKRVNWQNRAHFFGAAARIIRRVLVDHARTRGRLKRGGDGVKVSLNDAVVQSESDGMSVNVIELDRALTELEKLDPQQERIIELRFFAGLSIEETAEALNISAATVKRDWVIARAWLFREMTSG